MADVLLVLQYQVVEQYQVVLAVEATALVMQVKLQVMEQLIQEAAVEVIDLQVVHVELQVQAVQEL